MTKTQPQNRFARLAIYFGVAVFAATLFALFLYHAYERYELRRDMQEATAYLNSGNFEQDLVRSLSLPNKSTVEISTTKNAYRLGSDSQAQQDRRNLELKSAQENLLVVLRQQAEQHEQRIRLKPDEACLGGFAGRTGTIIVSSYKGGTPVRTQLIENGRPVDCIGDHRIHETVTQTPQNR